MNNNWFRGLPEEQKEQRIKEILSYRRAFEALNEVLDEYYEESSPNYDDPSWSHRQADVNGANRMLKRIKNLITIKDEE